MLKIVFFINDQSISLWLKKPFLAISEGQFFRSFWIFLRNIKMAKNENFFILKISILNSNEIL